MREWCAQAWLRLETTMTRTHTVRVRVDVQKCKGRVRVGKRTLRSISERYIPLEAATKYPSLIHFIKGQKAHSKYLMTKLESV